MPHSNPTLPLPSSAESSEPRQEGFWFSRSEPHLPYPVGHAHPGPLEAADLAALAQVEGAIEAQVLGQCIGYRGPSLCRHCGGINGSRSWSAEGWEWPQGLVHYVQTHHVELSAPFRAWIYEVAQRPEVAAVLPRVAHPVTPVAGFTPSLPAPEERQTPSVPQDRMPALQPPAVSDPAGGPGNRPRPWRP
jgi:hypothetical protein